MKKKKPPKHRVVHIEDVIEPHFKKRSVCLLDYSPEVAAEWYYKKNCGFGPEHFARASGVKAWWICSRCDRVWKAQINNRTMLRSGCPYCESKLVCEENSLADNFPAVAREWNYKRNGKLKPSDVMYASGKRVWWKCDKGHEWQAVISTRTIQSACCPHCYEDRMQYAREHPPVRVRGHVVLNPRARISRKFYEDGRKPFDNLADSFPKIAKQWHPTKNGKWKPSDFGKGSEAVAWWKCNRAPDHEWQAPIYSRTSKGTANCPFCTGKRVCKSNALATVRPDLAKLWHPTKNGGLKPTDVTAGSSRKIWWRCQRGADHVWFTSVSNASRHSRCPYCVGHRISKDHNLAAVYPEIAAEWHPKKNGKLLPPNMAPATSKKAWWRCKRNPRHEWEASIANRTRNGSGCPFCAGKRASVDNSLHACFPSAAREWHATRNGALKPSDVTPHSKRMVWWQCRKGHVWRETVRNRTKRKSGCKKCHG